MGACRRVVVGSAATLTPMETPAGPVWLDAADVHARLTPARAVAALRAALAGGLDPDGTPPRQTVVAEGGPVLLMPAVADGLAGVKVVGVAAGNVARGLPVVSGVYVLLDGRTLMPLALLDGTALTVVRTAAVTALAVDLLAAPEAATLVVFGAGAQARGHVAAVRSVRPVREVHVAGRDPVRREALVADLRATGLDAYGLVPEAHTRVLPRADVVVTATTATSPVFDGSLVADRAVVAAVGAFEPATRETDDALAARAAFVVESRAAALREAGDLLVPMSSGLVTAADVVADLGELVRGDVRLPPDDPRPRLFVSVGVAWEDLVVAAAAVDR